jgi:predicted Rossmann fold nucleotide-binding protein DprA/Smf involved in DNA uptake
MKYAIIGSRSFNDYGKLCSTMNEYDDVTEIISGGAKGADSLGALYASSKNIPLTVFRPDWSIGRHAGFLRNTQIIESSDVVVAFWDGESKGTLDSIKKAEKMGKLCVKIII